MQARIGRRMPAVVFLVIAGLIVGCQAGTPPSGPPAALPSAPSAAPATPSGAPAALDPAVLDGSWEGELSAGGDRFPVAVRLYGCVVGAVCGEDDYLVPWDPSQLQCGGELTLDEIRDDAFVLTERLTVRPWECVPSTVVVRPGADGTIDVELYGDLADPPCCVGTLARSAPGAAPTPLPLAGPVPGLGTPTAVLDLGSTTTQYTAEGFGSLWLPLDGSGDVIRVDAATGVEQARIALGGDPGAVELRTDPHAVAAAADGVWVTLAAAHAIALVDPRTNLEVRRIDVESEPYAIAIDGADAWVTSFTDNRLIHVDLGESRVVATVEVMSPTGVAIGEGGVWVVEHRINRVLLVDPDAATVTAAIELGEERPNDLCGMCVENVVVAYGSVWTANNEGRSVSRVDPRKLVAERIDLPMRAWAVAAGGGRIWASQMELEGAPVTDPTWQTASIDPGTGDPATYGLPSFSVAWAGDALWVVQPERRSDVLVRVEVEP